MSERSYVSQYSRDDIDEIASQEGNALRRQQFLGNLKSQPSKKGRQKSVRELADESAERQAQDRVQQEPPRDSFKKKGY